MVFPGDSTYSAEVIGCKDHGVISFILTAFSVENEFVTWDKLMTVKLKDSWTTNLPWLIPLMTISPSSLPPSRLV